MYLGVSNRSILGALKPIGMNLNQVDGGDEQAFLNIMKTCGGSVYYTCWNTASGTAGNLNDTGEEQFIPLDSDGYPTALSYTGKSFNQVWTHITNGLPTPVTGGYPYPSGTYRIQFNGKGTIIIGGDGSGTFTNSTTGAYSSTFNVSSPTSGGLTLSITALTGSSAGNYPAGISIVLSTNTAAYDAGGIFNPIFTATLANVSVFRFMDWRATNSNDAIIYTGAGNIAAGATSCTIVSQWGGPDGTYQMYFTSATTSAIYQKTATVLTTSGTTTASWSGGLSTACTYNPCIDYGLTFANRSLPSNCSWGTQQGVPFEVCIALCNQLNASMWMNVPLTWSDSDITSLNQLIYSGTGAQSGFAALNTNLSCFFELSNEVWNGAFAQYSLAGMLGGLAFPGQSSGGGNADWNKNWFGMRTAQMSTICHTVWGSAFSRCYPVLGAQAASDTATEALNCTYWSSGPASAYYIKAIAIAPYWGYYPSQTDVNTMTSQGDGGLSYFFQTLTSNVMTSPSNTLSSVPSTGWFGQIDGWINTYVTVAANFGLNLTAYEGGQNFLGGGSAPTGWNTLAISAQTDSRMGTAFTTYLNDWKTRVGAGLANINCLYIDVQPFGNGDWGILDSVMTTPTSAPKWVACQTYMTTP